MKTLMTIIIMLFSVQANSQETIYSPDSYALEKSKESVMKQIKAKHLPEFLSGKRPDDERIKFATFFGGQGFDRCIDMQADSKVI